MNSGYQGFRFRQCDGQQRSIYLTRKMTRATFTLGICLGLAIGAFGMHMYTGMVCSVKHVVVGR
jgi:hypothetical protein